MKKTFDPTPDGEVRQKGDPAAPRPKDAATLVILKKVAGKHCVLMGQRHRGHKFMPDRYVFPGGRVDRGDGYAPQAAALPARVARYLEKAASPFRARALALAAVRETFEETGLILGRPGEAANGGPRSWQHFFATGMRPALDRLDYLCRAVTPPYRPMRFNARFFVVHSEHLHGELGGSGELLYLDWLPIPDAMALKTPNITKRVLESLDQVIREPERFRRRRRTPLYHQVYGRHTFELE